MSGYTRITFSWDVWRTVSLRLMYLLVGSVLGLCYAALPMALIALDVTSVTAWASGCVLVAVMVFASGSIRWLRDLDREYTNKMLGTTVPVPTASGAIGHPAPSLWRRMLGATPGYPAWRATLWFTARAIFGLQTLGIVGIGLVLLLMIVTRLPEAATLSTSGAFVSAVRSIALVTASVVTLFVLVRTWASVPASFFVTAAPQLLGPSSAEQIAELRRRLHQVVQRDRLGRVLHDSAGRALAGIVRQAAAAGRKVHSDPEYACQALADIETVARAAHEQINKLLAGQSEDSLNMPPPSRADLDRSLRLVHRQGLPISTEISDKFDGLPDFLRQEVNSIVEEGCYNALSHAAYAPTHVIIAIRETELEVSIVNGPPADGAVTMGVPGAGRGLRDMAERVKTLGGTIEAGSLVEGGYRLRVLIPLPLVEE